MKYYRDEEKQDISKRIGNVKYYNDNFNFIA